MGKTWEWLIGFNWSNAGGSSFVQLWTGLNLAFIAWDKYQEALSLPRRKCDQIIQTTTCNVLDGSARIQVAAVFIRWSTFPVVVHRWVWVFCSFLALSCCVAGFYMLYADRYSPWDWVVMLPTVLYVVISTVNLALFWVMTEVVTWCCRTVAPASNAALGREISDLEKSTRPPK